VDDDVVLLASSLPVVFACGLSILESDASEELMAELVSGQNDSRDGF